MPDKPFVINDRRKFTAEGDIRPDAERSPEAVATAVADRPVDTESGRSSDEPADTGKPHREPIAFPASSPRSPSPEPGRSGDEPEADSIDDGPAARAHETIAFPSGDRAQQTEDEPEAADAELPPLTAEQIEQATRAYDATVERLDTALRANNLGSEPLPQMTFERLIQSLYMQTLMQLGGAAEPGQPPQVDLLGARQTIDMLSLIADKAAGNLSDAETKFVQSALFELRMGFLEVTQALARQAASRHPAGSAPGNAPGGLRGPGIVR